MVTQLFYSQVRHLEANDLVDLRLKGLLVDLEAIQLGVFLVLGLVSAVSILP
jgi:hypothetical protein